MSINGNYDDNNIFNKILLGEEPCIRVYEDSLTLAFMDVYPESPGHVLIIPKGVKARNFLDFPMERIGPYMQRVQAVTKAVKDALNPDGIIVAQYNGKAASQTVYHLHFHVIPCYDNIPLKPHNSVKASAAELQPYADKISEKINSS